MVAASGAYCTIEPITAQERQYGWWCGKCNRLAELFQIERNHDQLMTRFVIQCPGGIKSYIDMTDEYRERRPAVEHFSHPEQNPPLRQDNAQLQLRCLSGCGDSNFTLGRDNNRDGCIVTPLCMIPNLNIFVSEQTWRNGIKRISYRHDGNYVIFDNDMRVASEGRVEVSDPTLVPYGEPVELPSEYVRRTRGITVTGTQTITGTSSNAFDYYAQIEYQRRLREQQDRQQEADRQREEIWREYRDSDISQQEYERLCSMHGITSEDWEAIEKYERHHPTSTAAKNPQPRPARLVRRRALEKKEEKP